MDDLLYVASRKGLFKFERTGGGWSAGPPWFLGEPVSAMLADQRDGTLYAALYHGHFGCKLHRSDDAGGTWQELAPPAYPSADDGEGPSLEMIWTLVPGGEDQPGLLWAGTLPGGLFVSRDRGDSWALVESLWEKPQREKWFGGGYDHPGIHSVLVDPRDSSKITVAVSCGGVWKSDDTGGTWRQTGQGLRQEYVPPEQAFDPVTQDAHLISACQARPDRVWCQHHNGIFVSRDGAETFEEITDVEPSVFGFAVAAHPKDPDTAWFAPAVKDECRVPKDGRLLVNVTRDGGKSFERLTEGLPQEMCWDLIYRHALVVDGSGERLAMGSTTGNLWLSGTGGAAWQAVSTGLPPVAQVAFA